MLLSCIKTIAGFYVLLSPVIIIVLILIAVCVEKEWMDRVFQILFTLLLFVGIVIIITSGVIIL